MTEVRDPRRLSVLFVPGVGPALADRLARLGISTVRDLIFYFPFRYEETWRPGESGPAPGAVSITGTVAAAPEVRYRGRRSTLSVALDTACGTVRAVFFNQPYLRQKFQPGTPVSVRGRYDASRKTIVASSHTVGRFSGAPASALHPVYGLTADMAPGTLRKAVANALRVFGPELVDELPQSLRMKFRLLDLLPALRVMHAPSDQETLHQARRRLVFEEFLEFQLRIQGFRAWRQQEVQEQLPVEALMRGVRSFVEGLPFPLTAGQEQAIAVCLSELASTRPMNRFIQGDVGSGKTVVAFALAAGLAACGRQSALMAPTSILAAQHYRQALAWLGPAGIRAGYLAGGQDAREREAVVTALATGALDLVIGTHALAGDDVSFARLRLVMTDEQHRFGVETRRLFRQKGGAVDVLQLSATPIPRSLALSLYGDTAMTEIRDMPPDRVPIQTVWLKPSQEARLLRLLRRELAKGHQAYIVAPRIEEGEEEGPSAQKLFERMEEELSGFAVGLLHGALPERERDRVMASFAAGDTQALVATSIIEVGVSVERATVIAIYGADRFGLATLHQLRGRVGRSALPSVCVLVAGEVTDQARARLQAMLESRDGFALAEQDLRLRGPGEAFGRRQSGLPSFRLGDVVSDLRVMEAARQVAAQLIAHPDFWLLPAYRHLREIAKAKDDALADS